MSEPNFLPCCGCGNWFMISNLKQCEGRKFCVLCFPKVSLMTTETAATDNLLSRYTTCECGRPLPKSHLAHHKRHACKAVVYEGHCAYCRQPAVASMLEKLRAGMVPEEAAQALGLKTEYVQEVRTRARKHGCLPPAPKKGSPEYLAEREARAKFTMGDRTCIECEKKYTPQLGSVHQSTCSQECATERRNRLKRKERDGKPPPQRNQEPPADKEFQAMAPRQKWEAEIAAEADMQGRRIEATRDHQFRLFMELMGVAA